jgi:hypothetical protein
MPAFNTKNGIVKVGTVAPYTGVKDAVVSYSFVHFHFGFSPHDTNQ